MNLPSSFEHTMRSLLGEGYEAFREALLGEPAVSIRLNPAKWCGAVGYEPVPWATDAYYLGERPAFTFDPLLHGGCYYVQEASSMFVEQAVRQHLCEARVALDLCAAPGGKSTLLRSLLPDDCVLVSNEVMRPRAQVLAENMAKWGHPRCVVTSNYPADFTPLGETFDLILVDAPCSGEGMFRKDEVAVAEWSPENVAVCWQRQRDILTDIWPTLRPGGLLIYSTCTFNTAEDEENVRWMMQELGAQLDARIRNVMNSNERTSLVMATVMTALMQADEAKKAAQSADNLRKQLKSFFDDSNRTRVESEALRREVAQLRRETEELERKLAMR